MLCVKANVLRRAQLRQQCACQCSCLWCQRRWRPRVPRTQGTKGQYKSVLHCATTIAKEEGATALLRCAGEQRRH